MQAPRSPYVGHLQYCRERVAQLGIPQCSLDVLPVSLVWDRQYGLDLESFASGKPQRGTDGLRLFTDGSRLGDRTGSGFVVIHDGEVVHSLAVHLGEASVFQGELYALLRAAEWLCHSSLSEPAVIYSDSQAALLALSRPSVTSPLVLSVIQALNAACSSTPVTLRWIKAHVGYGGNELADEAAKQGASDASLLVPSPPPGPGPP